MCNILYTSRPNSGSISVSKVVTGMPDDTTYFHVILTGASSEIPIADGWIKTGQTIKFSGLPFDTYTLTEDAVEGYSLVSISGAVTLSRGNRSGSISVVNEAMPELTPIKYGALYNWAAASKNWGTDTGSIAPIGWHVPSKEEFTTLISEIGGYTNGYKLKEIGTNNWDEPNTGATNELLFNAKGAGYRYYNGEFYNLKKTLRLISITLIGGFDQILELSNTSPDVTQIKNGYNNLGFSVRLIKDDSNDPLILKDIDGNVYPTVKIGNQVWMAANLVTTHYNDGTVIPIVTGNTEWAALTTGAMCYYNNDITNA